MIGWVSAGCCFMASRSRHHYVPNDYLQFFKVTSVHLQPRARYQQHFCVLFWGDFTARLRWTLRSADSFNSSRYKYTQGQSLGTINLSHTPSGKEEVWSMEKRCHLNDICVRIEVQQEDTKHESLQSHGACLSLGPHPVLNMNKWAHWTLFLRQTEI